MNIPEDLKYTKSHEWVKIDNNIARVGITDFAQDELTDIVFAELPKEGTELAAGKDCAVLESVKTAADIYSPLTGKVTKVNQEVAEAPEKINGDPYNEGWLFELEIKDSAEIEQLLKAEQYKQLIDGDN